MEQRTPRCAAAAAPGGAATRQAWIDQVRWAAILLVVAGHAVGLMRGRSDVAVVISNFLYIFHIPALVLLAGWASRTAQAGGRGLSRIVWQLLVPYVIFQLLAFLVNYWIDGVKPSWSFTSQTFGLWFLVALAGWRLLGPWFHGLRRPVAAAVGVALLAGLSPDTGGFLSLSRIAFFLPFFVVGPYVVDQIARWRANMRMRLMGAAVLAGSLGWVVLSGRGFDRTIFFGRDSYQALGQGSLDGAVLRLGAMCLSLVLAVGFALVVPGRDNAPGVFGRWAARAGRHTMFSYLIHLPLLTVGGSIRWLHWGDPTLRVLVCLAAAGLLAVVTVTPPVRSIAQVLVDPRGAWKRLVRSRWTVPEPSRPDPATSGLPR